VRKIAYFVITIFLIYFPGYCHAQAVYSFEKIRDSELYTVKTEPVEGMMEFSETVMPPFGEYRIEIFLKNNSDESIVFNNARCEAVKNDGKIYYIELDEVELNTGEKTDIFILKPESIIIVSTKSPVKNDNLIAIYLVLADGTKIHFVPYNRLGNFVASPEQHLKNLLSGLIGILKYKQE